MSGVLNKPLLRKTAMEILHAFIPSHFEAQEKKTKKVAEEKEEDILVLTDKVFDQNYLRELDYTDERIEKMPRLLIEALPTDVKRLKEAYQKNDLKLLQDIAHKMKSAALYGGALRLKEACYRLEKYLHDGKKELVSDLYRLVLREVEAFNDLMKKT